MYHINREILDLSHQELLEGRFRQLNIPLSEYSFANLYLFRQIHRYEVITMGDEIFIKGLTRDQIPYVMLTSDPIKISLSNLQQALVGSDILFPISENWLPSFDKKIFQSSFKEEDSDYLFSRLKLVHFPGRHLDGKRNQIKQLLEINEVRSEEFSGQVNDAEEVLDGWQEEHGEGIQTDYSACKEAIHHFKQLHLYGHIVYVNQKPAGFIIGEWSSHDQFNVHFSKALRPIKGVNQYLLQTLAHSLGETCSWINLEQDLGIPSIRNSKLSYHPDFILKKWRISR